MALAAGGSALMTSARTLLLAALVALVPPSCSALKLPPATSSRPSRRVALRTMAGLALPVGLGLAPLPSRGAGCTCITLDNCVCTGADGEAAKGEQARKEARELAKVKAGGLYTSQTSTYSNYDQEIRKGPPAKEAPSKAAAKKTERVARDTAADLKPIAGLGSQNFAEADSSEAKRKFAAVLKDKVAEREAGASVQKVHTLPAGWPPRASSQPHAGLCQPQRPECRRTAARLPAELRGPTCARLDPPRAVLAPHRQSWGSNSTPTTSRTSRRPCA